ncbi:MAG: hypothetical protein IPO00_07535 [Betaproteobacteria bacterium]|nr:hypothetical protein [Betaproteobacteria bacterium]
MAETPKGRLDRAIVRLPASRHQCEKTYNRANCAKFQNRKNTPEPSVMAEVEKTLQNPPQ